MVDIIDNREIDHTNEVNDDWDFKECTTYDIRAPLTLEKIHSKHRACGHSGTIYTDDHGHEGFERYACGSPIDPKCLQHRITRKSKEFAYLNSEKYVIHVFDEHLENRTAKQIHTSLTEFKKQADAFKYYYPGMWFRYALLNNKTVLILEKDEPNAPPGKTIPFEDFIKGYVDWTQVQDDDAIKMLLIHNKGFRHILQHGKKPDEDPTACNRSVSGFSLKTTGGEIITEEKRAESKVPLAVYVPIEKLKYIVDPIPLSGQTKPITIDFNTFAKERIVNNKYLSEWEQYHGDLESARMQKYLAWLYQVNPGQYGFLKKEIHRIKEVEINRYSITNLDCRKRTLKGCISPNCWRNI